MNASPIDYFQNDSADLKPSVRSQNPVINDITGLNPITVQEVERPDSIHDLIHIVKNHNGPISIGGGRFSMGGHTASPKSLHLDLRDLNAIEDFSAEHKTITVQSGTRWCDIQKHIDPYNLSVSIMQTYANFTVGGSLSVNVHGRYLGAGPLILSVKSIDVLLANGTVQQATPKQNHQLFNACIGGYNAVGIIIRAQLQLTDNTRVKRHAKKMKRSEYLDYFKTEISTDESAVFHNADLYPPHFNTLRSVTWKETEEQPTTKERLQPLKRSYWLEQYFYWAFSETPFGKWRREHLVDPFIYSRKKVHWRNFEAGYDVAELEPRSRKKSTYVLQEYFIPIQDFDSFAQSMGDVFKRYKTNVINVSIRHALPDSGSLMAWAREEVFAFVIYYKQGTGRRDKEKVELWTQELVDLATSLGGSYYLPYQTHASIEQFHKAYPQAKQLFQLKETLDPQGKFKNALWDKYNPTKPNQPKTMTTPSSPATPSEFISVFSNDKGKGDFYQFLQEIFRLFPEDDFHRLIKTTCETHSHDEAIYREVQKKLPTIKPFLADLTYSLPSLKKQKKEMAKQSLELLGNETPAFNGYLEIGSTGRYLSHLKKHRTIKGPIYLTNDQAPGNSIEDIIERGQLKKSGTFIDLDDYAPISQDQIPSDSLDLVTCYIGLHHCPTEKLDAYLKSIHRILRPGGKFIMRDHDVATPEMETFASLVHTVFNLGTNESWEFNHTEFRCFKSIDDWCQIAEKNGFTDSGKRLLQKNDPSLNTLVMLTK